MVRIFFVLYAYSSVVINVLLNRSLIMCLVLTIENEAYKKNKLKINKGLIINNITRGYTRINNLNITNRKTKRYDNKSMLERRIIVNRKMLFKRR